MTPPTPDNLEVSLTGLTTWRGPTPELWQRAMDSANIDTKAEPSFGLYEVLRKPLSNTVMLVLVGCAVVALMVGVILPPMGKARQSARRISGFDSMPTPAAALAENNADGYVGLSAGERQTGQVAASPEPGKPSDLVRQVIQKATIELQTPDVRAAFAKANHLISAAGGEFVENTSLIGDGKTAQANLTLRVAATRLGEVLTQLRELGQVKSENTTGEDVTTQVVDLESRIRNEQRIESELLELLDKRADAPLKDVLELRNSLSSVRQSIEQYIAQRDRLSRLVSLASILVVIRAETAPEPESAQSIFSYFKHTIAEAWHDGLRTASDSVSWLVSLLISGVLWWLLIAAVIVSILRYRRRLAARCV